RRIRGSFLILWMRIGDAKGRQTAGLCLLPKAALLAAAGHAQLCVFVAPPAVHHPARGHAAGVTRSSADAGKPQVASHCLGATAAQALTTVIVGVEVTELATII